MTGTAVTRPPVAAFGRGGGGVAPGNDQTPSTWNSNRLAEVIKRLNNHVRGLQKWTPVEFVNLCLSLARSIDYAIANNEVPSKSQELPQLMKLVCQDTNDPFLLSAYMVLMISVKIACNSGWFTDKDSEDLKNLAKEIANKFGSASDFNSVPSCSLDVISTIMSRFYPKMRMGHIFVLLEVKPGFEAYVADFQISKDRKPSPGEKASLFVVQTDNIETSACLISPAKANFILNGKGVARRINSNLDTGPQIPTVVTNFLKFGSNLLQAVGEFSGNYIVAVVFMSDLPNPDGSALQDYEQQSTAVLDSDSEIIEGSSRVSLHCPISHRHIKTPVKGRSCHHVQCFDFNNYVEINSRRPNWRCPSCNQPVCFSDIRIDRKMVKVLEEVGLNVSSILISSDGSWNAEMESENAVEKPEGVKSGTGTGEPPESDVLDLTQIDDPMDATDTVGTQDMKNVLQFMSQNAIINPSMVNRNDVNQSSTPIPDDFWSGISLPTIVQPNAQVGCGPTTLSIDSFNFPIVGFEPFQGLPLPMSQNETSLPNTLPLQQQFGDGRFPFMPGTVIRNAVQALPAATPNPLLQQTPLNFIRNNFSAASQPQISPAASLPVQTSPVAPPVVQRSPRNSPNTNFPNAFTESSQALTPPPGMPSPFHAQSLAPVPQQTSRNGMNTSTSNSPAAASQTVPNVAPSLHVNPRHASQVSIPPLAQHRYVQQTPFPRQLNQQHPYPVAQQHHQNTGFRNPNQVQNALRVSNEHCASSQQVANTRAHPVLIQTSVQSLQNFMSRPGHLGNRSIQETGPPISQQASLIAAANRTAKMATESLRPSPSLSWNNPEVSSQQLPGDYRGRDMGVASSQPATNTDPNDRNWQPAGRMRGALTGPAYANAFNQFIVRPSQQAQAARSLPRPNSLPLPSDISTQLQSIMSSEVAPTPVTLPAQANNASAGPASASDPFANLDGMP